MSKFDNHFPNAREFWKLFSRVLGPESAYYKVIMVYSVVISLLTLAVPISVQMLIDSVSNTGMFSAVVTLGVLLFSLLFISGVLYALRAWSMELFSRRIFSRIASEIAMTGLLAKVGYFEESDNHSLFNRFFDIMTLKKSVPYLLSYGFTLFFQTLIGFVVVSLYHQYFLVFSICLVLMLYLVWKLWGWKSIESAFVLSEAKHKTAGWLQALGINAGFYKPGLHSRFAIEKTEAFISEHISAQKIHFRFNYSQLLTLLFLYALASAVLLTIGGWLVIHGQLTLGQLVAAELIMSAIFYNLPQLSGYLEYFYDVCAATEELNRFTGVELDADIKTSNIIWPESGALVLAGAGTVLGTQAIDFSLRVPERSLCRVDVSDGVLQQALVNLLRGDLPLRKGEMAFGTVDLSECSSSELRQGILVIERQTMPPLTIREYLKLPAESVTTADMHRALALVGLEHIGAELSEGLDTRLSAAGTPLLLTQALRLKLAFALLSPCRVLVLGHIFDCLPAAFLNDILKICRQQRGLIVLCFTSRPDLSCMTHKLELGIDAQQVSEVPGKENSHD